VKGDQLTQIYLEGMYKYVYVSYFSVLTVVIRNTTLSVLKDFFGDLWRMTG